MRTSGIIQFIAFALLALLVAGCGGGDGDDGRGDSRKASERSDSAKESEGEGEGEGGGGGERVDAELMVRLENVGGKSSGAGIPVPTGIACTKSLPATCNAEYTCPAPDPVDEAICAWLAADAARDVLLGDVPKDQMCTEQYGGDERATVVGTLDGEKVERTFSRTDGCEISRFDAASPLWSREALLAGNPSTIAGMCVAEDPDQPVSSDNPPVPCEDTVVVRPEVITDPPEAFER